MKVLVISIIAFLGLCTIGFGQDIYDPSEKVASKFIIPGDTTFTSGKQPIFIIHTDSLKYLIDDMKGEPLSKLDPSEIEELNVLKDESAKRIYGEKGENGAIVIQMKEGVKVDFPKKFLVED